MATRFFCQPSLHVACLVASVATLAAQAGSMVPVGSGAIRGQIVDRESGRGLPHAIVTLEHSGGGQLKTATTEDGRYHFDNLGVGGYRLLAALDGYAEEGYSPAGRGNLGWPTGDVRELGGGRIISPGLPWLGLAERQVREGVNVALSRGGVVAGRVMQSSGAPARRAIVRAERLLADGSVSYNRTSQVIANDDGEYVISNLRPGLYRLAITWYDSEMMRAGTRANSDPTYFPGTTRSDEATSVRVEPGRRLGDRDIRLPAAELYRLAGHVLRAASMGEIEVYFLTAESKMRTVRVRDDGAFDVTHIEPGRHTLWARAATDDGFEAASITLELGSDMTGLVLPMRPAGSIRGRLITEDGSPVSGDGLQIVADLVDAHGALLDPLPRDRADVETDGTFELRGLFGYRRMRVSLNYGQVADVVVGRDRLRILTFNNGERYPDTAVIVPGR